MKSKWIKGCAAVGAAWAIGLWLLPWSSAEEPEDNPLAEQQLEVQAELEQLEHAKRAVAEAKREAAKFPRVAAWAGSNSMASLRAAAEKLRDAEGDEAKTAADTQLRQLLSDYFDLDMERRAEELKNIEERVRTLRAQLERRGSRKPDIIDLQVKVLVNEADGLGFFSDHASSGFIFGGPEPWTITIPKIELPFGQGGMRVAVPDPPVKVAPPVAPESPRARVREQPAEPAEEREPRRDRASAL